MRRRNDEVSLFTFGLHCFQIVVDIVSDVHVFIHIAGHGIWWGMAQRRICRTLSVLMIAILRSRRLASCPDIDFDDSRYCRYNGPARCQKEASYRVSLSVILVAVAHAESSNFEVERKLRKFFKNLQKCRSYFVADLKLSLLYLAQSILNRVEL